MQRLKSIIYKVGLVILVIFVIDAGLVFGFATYRPALPERADAIVVLGAAIYSPALQKRTITALDLYQQGRAGIIVLSGGRISDRDITEAQYMHRVISLATDKPVSVLQDDQAGTTYENIQNTKKLLPNAHSLIIVSDSFHLARAVLLAKRAGFEDVYWRSPDQGHYNAVDKRYYYSREFAAMLWYIPKFIFN